MTTPQTTEPMPTPTDELNRLLDAIVEAVDYSHWAEVPRARAAIVAHFEKVTLTPEEAELLTADHTEHCWQTMGNPGDDCTCGAAAINVKLCLLSDRHVLKLYKEND